jgi:GNAT superfamily N-acetyltransferase
MMLIRPMTHADIPAGLALCRAAHWNQTARDWEQFLSLNPDGARVADRDGRVVATVTTLDYEERLGWIAMVLVDPAERRQGLGTTMLATGLGLLEPLPAVGLDATAAGYPIYVKRGFRETYRLARMERRAWAPVSPPAGTFVRPFAPRDWTTVRAWDLQAYGADRSRMLEWLHAGAPQYAWVAEDAGSLVGYALGRSGFAFEHLGPIVARDDQAAAALVAACTADNRAPFIVDALIHSPGWRAWLNGAGFREQRPFIRMRRGGDGAMGRPHEQFASIGPEFG